MSRTCISSSAWSCLSYAPEADPSRRGSKPRRRRHLHRLVERPAEGLSDGSGPAMRGEVAGWAPNFTVEWLKTLELLTSELITDALLHADSPQMDVTDPTLRRQSGTDHS